MKKFIEIIKDIRGNKRKKAAVILGLYLIFFGVIIIMTSLNSGSSTSIETAEEQTTLEKFGSINDYTYELSINKDSNIDLITGSCNDVCNIIYNEVSYDYSLSLRDELGLNVDLIKKGNIVSLINDSDLYSTTTLIENNEVLNTYKIEDTYITTYELEEIIYKVEIEYSTSYIIDIIFS